MEHDRSQARRKSGNFRRPIGEQRGRRHQKPRFADFPLSSFFNTSSSDKHLDRLAESHVVGKTRAKSEPREQIKPLHTRPADRPAKCRGAIARDRPAEPIRLAQGRPASLRARVRRRSGSNRCRLVRQFHLRQCRPRPANAWPRRTTDLGGGPALDRLELLERPAQTFMVDFDPLAANQGQSSDCASKSLDLGPRQGFAVERHLHPEVEQRVHPELRWRLAADRRLHLRTRGAVHAPARRHPHDHAGAFQAGTSFRNCSACCGLQRSG